jgi:hypothetical protein
MTSAIKEVGKKESLGCCGTIGVVFDRCRSLSIALDHDFLPTSELTVLYDGKRPASGRSQTEQKI